MIWKKSVMSFYSGSMVFVAVCVLALVAAMPGFGYTSADVKRGEDMLAIRDYKRAIEILSGIPKDFDFCAANPTDAARAGMLLCDAYEGNGEKDAEACKAAAELTKTALIQIWASLKKTEPDAKKRLEKMAEVCEGHPQAFADFLKVFLPKLQSDTDKANDDIFVKNTMRPTDVRPDDDMRAQLNIAFGLYEKLIDAHKPIAMPKDLDLLILAADSYTRLQDHKKVISILNEALTLIPKTVSGKRIDIMFQLMEAYQRADDSEATISTAKKCLELELEADQIRMVRCFIIWALKRQVKFDEAIEMLKALAKDEPTEELRVRRTSEIADIYLYPGKYQQALDVLLPIAHAKGISDGMGAHILYNIAVCYSRLNREELSLNYQQELTRLYPESVEAMKVRGVSVTGK